MKLIIASNNAHKLIEIKDILGGMFDEIVSLKEWRTARPLWKTP